MGTFQTGKQADRKVERQTDKLVPSKQKVNRPMTARGVTIQTAGWTDRQVNKKAGKQRKAFQTDIQTYRQVKDRQTDRWVADSWVGTFKTAGLQTIKQTDRQVTDRQTDR